MYVVKNGLTGCYLTRMDYSIDVIGGRVSSLPRWSRRIKEAAAYNDAGEAFDVAREAGNAMPAKVSNLHLLEGAL